MTESSLQPRKKRARRGVRYQMELNFDTEDAKQALQSRIDSAKRYLAPKGSSPLDSGQLLSLLLDKVDLEAASTSSLVGYQEKAQAEKHAIPMLENSGLCIILYDQVRTMTKINYNYIQGYSLAMIVTMTISCLSVNGRPFTAC